MKVNKSVVLALIASTCATLDTVDAALKKLPKNERTLRMGKSSSTGTTSKSTSSTSSSSSLLCDQCSGVDLYDDIGGNPTTCHLSDGGSNGKSSNNGRGRRNGGGRGGKSSSKSSSTTCSVEVSDLTLVCGGPPITGEVTMSSDLYCDANNSPGFGGTDCAVTLSGPDAVLDCQGLTITHADNDPQGTAGICLMGGATAKNCNIGSNFLNGVRMMDGDNNLFDSSLYRNNCNQILTSGTGCMTVAGVTVGRDDNGGCENHGLSAQHMGTINIIDSDFVGGQDDGIRLGDSDLPLCASLDGVRANYNEDDGLEVDRGVYALDIRNSEFQGNSGEGVNIDLEALPRPDFTMIVEDSNFSFNRFDGLDIIDLDPGVTLTLDLIGTNTFNGNADNGLNVVLEEVGSTGTATLSGDIAASSNGLSGIFIEDEAILVTFVDDSDTVACNNLGVDGDIDISGTIAPTIEDDAELQCNRFETLVAGVVVPCDEICPTPVFFAEACT